MNPNVFMKKVEDLAKRSNVSLNVLVVSGVSETKPFEKWRINGHPYSVMGFLDFVKNDVSFKLKEVIRKGAKSKEQTQDFSGSMVR